MFTMWKEPWTERKVLLSEEGGSDELRKQHCYSKGRSYRHTRKVSVE